MTSGFQGFPPRRNLNRCPKHLAVTFITISADPSAPLQNEVFAWK